MSLDDALALRFHNRQLCETLRLEHRWDALEAEHVVMLRPKPHDFSLDSTRHYIALLDAYSRRDGETYVDGHPRSTLREYRSKLIFIPAGCRLQGWSQPGAAPVAFTAAYLNPAICAHLDAGEPQLYPMLYFEHPLLVQMMLQLARILAWPAAYSRMYAESFSILLISEMMHIQAAGLSQAPPTERRPPAKGGLASWQRQAVCDYIEETLNQDISLAELATIARLSPYHFCRAFKEAVGEPPHRYRMSRRVRRAEELLANPSLSVGDVAATVGYSSPSRFSALFRQVTGHSPRDYRRKIA